MSRKGKIELLVTFLALYFILFFSNNQTKMNMGIIYSNENKIAELKENKASLEEELDDKTKEYELYNNDVNKYISLINKTSSLEIDIEQIKNQIDNYQSKIEELNNIIKDN